MPPTCLTPPNFITTGGGKLWENTCSVTPPPVRQKIKVGSCYLGHFPTSFWGGGTKDFFSIFPSYQYSGDKKVVFLGAPPGLWDSFLLSCLVTWADGDRAPEFYFYHAPPVFPLPSGLLLIFFFARFVLYAEASPPLMQISGKNSQRQRKWRRKELEEEEGRGLKTSVSWGIGGTTPNTGWNTLFLKRACWLLAIVKKILKYSCGKLKVSIFTPSIFPWSRAWV